MSLFASFRILVVGFCMGAVDLIPGVSGGTVAFVAGIYDRLINSIKTFDATLLRLVVSGRIREAVDHVPVAFFLPLGIGAVTAVFTLSRALTWLFDTHPVQLWAFFFGLVFGAVLILARETWPWRAADWLSFLTATVLTYLLVGLPGAQLEPTYPNFFIGGAIAICAFILPGLSGAYMLVILGLYQDVLEAVNARDVALLAVLVAGIVFGGLSFVRVVSWLLRRHRHVTLVALTGVMLGAMRTVWPWKDVLTTRVNSAGEVVPLVMGNVLPAAGGEVAGAVALALAGAVLVVGVSRLAPREAR